MNNVKKSTQDQVKADDHFKDKQIKNTFHSCAKLSHTSRTRVRYFGNSVPKTSTALRNYKPIPFLCTLLPNVSLCHCHFLLLSVESINHNGIVVILNLCYSFLIQYLKNMSFICFCHCPN